MANFLAAVLWSLMVYWSSTVSGENWDIVKWGRRGSSGSSSTLKRYCESWRMNVEVNNIKGFSVVPQECVAHVNKYMTSSQYKSDCETAVEQVRLYLSSCCSIKGDARDAWIFDIDDTLLSTVPYFKIHGFGGEKMNWSRMEAWMKESKAPAIEETVGLFHEIRNRGVQIFLVSSRKETLRPATVDNLIKVGFHGWTRLILRGLEEEIMEVGKYKSRVRQRLVEEEGYRIWGIVGDQWSSFHGRPSAHSTFKLPNSIYYLS
ncbi:acid phosphatase 1-like [Prosopis cineraria]|uniref:acid phosphatase 1-like n=1 Tax=Prosopis cineraria TaxID=364024 RepID=UPI00240FAABE|nr:acid phosphatase 1-like [Prosopis cineraria]